MMSFREAVDQIIAANIEDRAERMAAIQRLTDDYVGRTDEENLTRLTDYILREELTDKSRTKTQTAEYPFLSERQLERRYESEYSLTLAESYDLDGVNRAKPERRHRIAREERFIDKVSRQKNRVRNAQYRRDTSPGPVESYSLRETGGELGPEFIAAAGVAETWRERLSLVY